MCCTNSLYDKRVLGGFYMDYLSLLSRAFSLSPLNLIGRERLGNVWSHSSTLTPILWLPMGLFIQFFVFAQANGFDDNKVCVCK